MSYSRAPLLVAALVATLGLGACSSDGLLGGTTTAALPEKPRVDPACVTLSSQIDTLRKEGVADRVAEAAKGKGATVSVKRESLAKVAELNKANAEFQAKCGTVAPAAATLTPATPAPAQAKAVSSTPPVAVKTKAAAATAPAQEAVKVAAEPAKQ